MPLTSRLARLCIAGATSLAALTAAAGLAEAAPGFVTENINMRAGPDVSYPLVAQLPQGAPVEIYGCLQGYSWCDTQAGGARGWVAGPGLQVEYDQAPEPLVGYGAAIGLPFIGFDFDNYWGSYYRGRPWYSREDRWHPGGFRGPGYGPGGFDHGAGRPGPWQGGPIHGGPGFGPGAPGGQGGYRGPERGGPRPGGEMQGARGGGPAPGQRPGGPGGAGGAGGEHHEAGGGHPGGGDHHGPDDHPH